MLSAANLLRPGWVVGAVTALPPKQREVLADVGSLSTTLERMDGGCEAVSAPRGRG